MRRRKDVDHEKGTTGSRGWRVRFQQLDSVDIIYHHVEHRETVVKSLQPEEEEEEEGEEK